MSVNARALRAAVDSWKPMAQQTAAATEPADAVRAAGCETLRKTQHLFHLGCVPARSVSRAPGHAGTPGHNLTWGK